MEQQMEKVEQMLEHLIQMEHQMKHQFEHQMPHQMEYWLGHQMEYFLGNFEWFWQDFWKLVSAA